MRVHTDNFRTLDGSRETRVARIGDGSVITRFDKTPFPRAGSDVVCPHFLELKWGTGCPYSCAWCYLQGTFRFFDYKTRPRPKPYDRLEKHLLAFFDGDGVRPELLNSGELCDSFMMEGSKQPFTTFVMNLFDMQARHRILFVTKSTRIENLMSVPNVGQAVVSYSLNSNRVSGRWEVGAPTVKDRIEAAGRLKDAGFEVRIRLDPVVPIEGWEEDYSDLVSRLFSRFTPDRITLGSLRGLPSTIANARDRSWISFLDEKSNWGRKVAFETRFVMYQTLIDELKFNCGYKKVGLCKETIAMWKALRLNRRRVRCNCTQ